MAQITYIEGMKARGLPPVDLLIWGFLLLSGRWRHLEDVDAEVVKGSKLV